MDRSLALHQLLKDAGVAGLIPKGLGISGEDPVFRTPFRVGEAAAIALGAQGLLVSGLWKLRTGREQEVKVDLRSAALSLQSALCLRQSGYPVPLPDPDYPTVDFYQGSDGRWIFLHGGYPALRDGILKTLECANDRESIARAVRQHRAQELEDRLAAQGLTAACVRTPEEWDAHPQGLALAETPVVEVERIGEAPPEPIRGRALRPLSGLRVLDLTHVLAGPTCGRTLAESGADVLRITAPQRPNILPFSMDTGHGKRSAYLDLTRTEDREKLSALARGADLFCQSYRPGALAGLGVTPEEFARIRPGIICVSVSCFGHRGPWMRRPGWEQLAQSVSGMAHAQGEGGVPSLSPVFPNDYVTGYLAAFGALAALYRRSIEGGSYHVRVSLTRTAMWIRSLGMVSPELARELTADEVESRMMESRTPYGILRHLAPVTDYSETQALWALPSAPLGAHEPVWMPLEEECRIEAWPQKSTIKNTMRS